LCIAFLWEGEAHHRATERGNNAAAMTRRNVGKFHSSGDWRVVTLI